MLGISARKIQYKVKEYQARPGRRARAPGSSRTDA
jgi:hypothetical protein